MIGCIIIIITFTYSLLTSTHKPVLARPPLVFIKKLKDLFVLNMVLLGFGYREPITSEMAVSARGAAMPHATLLSPSPIPRLLLAIFGYEPIRTGFRCALYVIALILITSYYFTATLVLDRPQPQANTW